MLDRKALGTPMLVMIIAIALAVMAAVLYVRYALSATAGPANYTPSKPPIPSISASIATQDLLYRSNSNVSPYVLVSFNALNVSQLSASASIYRSAIPRSVYVLNINNECFNCGASDAIDAAIAANLVRYGIVGNESELRHVDIVNVSTLQPNTLLVVLNGLLPGAFFSKQGTSNTTLVQSLLNHGVSIIYAGQDFSHMLLPGSIVVPTNLTELGFLSVSGPSSNTTTGYYFNRSTFSLSGGTMYGPMSYEHVGNGSIIVFPNTPNSWSSPSDVGHDVAFAVQQLFWLERYSQGAALMNYTAGTRAGSLGIMLSPSPLTPRLLAQLNNGTARVALKAVSPAINSSNTVYSYVYFAPSLSLNGSMSIPPQIIPGATVPVTMVVFTRSSVPISIQPHISIYTTNMLNVGSIPLPFTNATGNFTFIKYINFGLGPGSYIAVLQSFTNVQYAASAFNVSPVEVSLVDSDFALGAFRFSVVSNGQPISGINYTISINGAYPSRGVTSNGTIVYSLPAGTPAQQGNIDFTVSLLGLTMHYSTYNAPTAITINKQYIELAVVAAVALMMVVLVRAPNRDEFYIDVPSLPAPQRTTIELKPKDVLAVFDKLNMSYHWRYMPLSLSELRIAITSNIRYNNMPVGLTYSNIESLLNRLSVNGYVVQSDGMYAPKEWEQLSNHDIDYLATFKKLRLFLVTHAYVFTELDTSSTADIVATLRGERKYLVIYSKTSKFRDVPIFAGSKTYLVFLNAYKLEEFRSRLYQSAGAEAEELRAYLSADMVRLVDADSPVDILS